MSVSQKLKVLASIDPRWALQQITDPSKRAYYVARLFGRTHFDATIAGFPLRFSTFAHIHYKVAKEMAAGNEWERSLVAAWKEKAAKASVVYDVGGFNGLFGIVAAKTNPNARVVIFEPDPYSARHVEENIKLNNVPNCALERVALTDTVGEVFFSAKGKLGSHISRHDHGLRVKASTLDSYPPASLIKIDVEGVEAKVIAGGKQSLESCPTIFIEVHDQLTQAERDEMWGTLRSFGYSWKQVGDSSEGNPHFVVEASESGKTS